MEEKKITLKIGGESLVGKLFLPSNSSPKNAMIFLNGSGGLKERFYGICKFFSEKGYVCLCFDFRGRGESVTKKIPKLKEQTVDAKKVINYLTQNTKSLEKVYLVATSMGGYVAATISNFNNKIKNLILIAPAICSQQMEESPYTEVRSSSFKKEFLTKANSIKEIRQFTGDLWVVFLGKDETIPDWMTQAYLDNAASVRKKKKIILKNEEHAVFRYKNGQEKIKELLNGILGED